MCADIVTGRIDRGAAQLGGFPASAGLGTLGGYSEQAAAQACSCFGTVLPRSSNPDYDYSADLNNLIVSLNAAKGGCALLGRGLYKFSTPIVLLSGVSLVGEGAATILAKSPSFVGSALVTIGASSPTGITLDGFCISDQNATKVNGGGLLIERASYVVVNDVIVSGHKSWGVIVRESGLCSFSNLTCTANGQDAVSGGMLMEAKVISGDGVVINCRVFNSYFGKNAGSQIILTGTGGNVRVAGLVMEGCRIEHSGVQGATAPLLRMDCAERITFIHCKLVASSQSIRCVTMGSPAGLEVKDVSFHSCLFDFSQSPAVLVQQGVTSASFFDQRRAGTGAVLIDANAVAAPPKIMISAMPPIKQADVLAAPNVVLTNQLQAPV